jgi:hypothetical protein
MRTTDAIEPLATVVNVSRFPVDFDILTGRTFMCPLVIFSRILPVRFNIAEKHWEPLLPVKDFKPDILRVIIDVADEQPESDPKADYVFILGGRWVGQGITIMCMETVCIIARQMTGGQGLILEYARKFEAQSKKVSGENHIAAPFSPELENSYERVGFVRGTGSLKAWEEAKVPAKAVYLF